MNPFWKCLPVILVLLHGMGKLHAESCPDPVQIQAITILNTTCGNATGALLVDIAGGNSGYTYTWQPAVSSTNSAFNLPAGAYQVNIVRNNDPSCFLDTTLIVSNSNGPSVQLMGVEPANCLLSNGSVTLGPSNLVYQWSNGESGSVNTGLSSGCYLITATNTGTGCANVVRVCVPNASPLETYVLVQNGALCGQNTGQAEVLVTGGSGNYSYSLGAGAVFQNLQAGDYECFVVDNVSGCLDSITFNVPAVQASATVYVLPHDIVCHGGPKGFVEFSVAPGLYFQLPYTFSITDAAGTSFAPDELEEGTYFLEIRDANNCVLPVDTFQINEPDLLQAQATVSPDACQTNGQILLQIEGGNGGYRVDWADISGQNDGADRLNLSPGYYQAIVYDTFFCTDTLPQVPVTDACAETHYIHLAVPVNASRSYCVPAPAGVGVAATDLSLLSQDASGVSAFGAWSLNVLDCLQYQAGSTPGFAVDTICVVQSFQSLNIKDTFCVVVTITVSAPGTDTVFFTLQEGTQGIACGYIPVGWINPVIVQGDQPGLTGNSGAFGSYVINAFSNCITFSAGDNTGFNVDTICVLISDTVQNLAHITCFVPSVLPEVDCAAGIFAQDSINLFLTECPATAHWCAPVSYPDILNYYIFDNGLPYTGGSVGCAFDTVSAYPVSLIPPGGPYQMNEWNIDGTVFSGAFSNAAGLLALMQQIDPEGHWELINGQLIAGGAPGSAYSSIKITSGIGAVAVLPASPYALPRGSELRFSPGTHELVLRRIQTGCADTVQVNVICIDCPAVHNYVPDIFGNIRWTTTDCAADTVFCTIIPYQNIGQYSITENGVPVTDFTPCGAFAGIRMDTGFHDIRVTELPTACTYTVSFYLACPENVLTDTLEISIPVGGSELVCPNLSVLPVPLASAENICAPGSGKVSYDADIATGCITLYGDAPGEDLLCWQFCNSGGICATYYLKVEVLEAPDDTLIAVPDAVQLLPGGGTAIPILENDIIDGITGYLDGVGTVLLWSGPDKGNASYLPASGHILYTPDPGACGEDQITYILIDTRGRRDTAVVSIQIACEKVLVYTGFSPNGDGVNDVWRILGMEQYPENEVLVFNRWGNLVFQQKGYSNQDAWNGKWNGKDVPDGAYFYVIDLGDGSARLSGYVQLMR